MAFLAVPAACALIFRQEFGGWIPNSVGRKVSRAYGAVDSLWFLKASLLSGSSALFGLLALVAILRRALPRAPAAYRLAHLLSQAAAYTILPPAEPYSWYIAQSQFSLVLLGIPGLLELGSLLRNRLSKPAILMLAALVLLPALPVLDRGWLARMKHWSDVVEGARIAAGRWADANLPSDATIRTSFGLPAYFGRRRTWDTSGLTTSPATVPAWLPPDGGEVYEIDCRFTALSAEPDPGATSQDRLATFRASESPRYMPTYLAGRDFVVTIERRRLRPK